MKVDLRKLIDDPAMWEKSPLVHIHLETGDIQLMTKVRRSPIGFYQQEFYENVISLGRSLAIVLPDTPQVDEGVAVLRKINTALTVVNTWEINKSAYEKDVGKLTLLGDEYKKAVGFLNECALKYA